MSPIRDRGLQQPRTPSLQSRNPGRLSFTPSTAFSPSEPRFGIPGTPTSIFAPRSSISSDPVKNNPAPMAEMRFRRIAAPVHDDTGLEGIFDGGLKLVDEPEILTQSEVRREREGLAEVLGRLGLLLVAGAVVCCAPPGLKVLGLPAVVTAALWRMVRTSEASRVLSAVEILATIGTGAATALGAAEDSVLEKVGMGIVAVAAVMEVWRLLLRMQRQRKRAFWTEERKRVLEAEKQGRREAKSGSRSPTPGFNPFGFRSATSSQSPGPGMLGSAPGFRRG